MRNSHLKYKLSLRQRSLFILNFHKHIVIRIYYNGWFFFFFIIYAVFYKVFFRAMKTTSFTKIIAVV